MNRRIYDYIESEYDRRRKRAQELMAARRKEVYGKVPELRELEEQIRNTGLSYSRQIVSGENKPEQASEALQEKIGKLRKKKARLLKNSGFPADYLNPVYECKKCNDTGFIGDERCSCFRQQLILQLYRESNLYRLETENWNTFDEKLYPDRVDENRYGIKKSPRKNILFISERCRSFVDNFSSPEQKNLFFSGPPGTGKTFMTSCIAGDILKMGYTVLYQTAPVLFNTIGKYKMKAYRDGEFNDEIYESIFNVNMLVIDDLGTESTTASRYAELLNILNTRELNNRKKPCKTIISTNLGPEKLYESYTERVGSRIMGNFERLMFAGDDIRNLTFSPS